MKSSLAKKGGSRMRRVRLPLRRATCARRAIERAQQRLDLVEQRGAGRGELESARSAHEQTDAERFLQLLHLVTDRGGSQVQLVGGELEAAVTGGDAEHPQVPGRRRA